MSFSFLRQLKKAQIHEQVLVLADGQKAWQYLEDSPNQSEKLVAIFLDLTCLHQPHPPSGIHSFQSALKALIGRPDDLFPFTGRPERLPKVRNYFVCDQTGHIRLIFARRGRDVSYSRHFDRS